MKTNTTVHWGIRLGAVTLLAASFGLGGITSTSAAVIRLKGSDTMIQLASVRHDGGKETARVSPGYQRDERLRRSGRERRQDPAGPRVQRHGLQDRQGELAQSFAQEG